MQGRAARSTPGLFLSKWTDNDRSACRSSTKSDVYIKTQRCYVKTSLLLKRDLVAMHNGIYAGLLFSIATFVWYSRRGPRNPENLPYPPGPKPLPLIGNVYDVPRDVPWKVFEEWGRKYGKQLSVDADRSDW